MTNNNRHRDRNTSWFADKRWSLVLAALFFCAQLIVVTHQAAHADDNHYHDSNPCIVATAQKISDDIDLAPPAPELAERTSSEHIEPEALADYHGTARDQGSIRAPPTC